MAAKQPLFAQERPSSVTSEDRAARDDDALLGNQRGSSNGDEIKASRPSGFWREALMFLWALLATCMVIVLAVALQHQHKQPIPGRKFKQPTGKRNLIFMVSDGSAYSL
jgi:alkaline phosphatase